IFRRLGFVYISTPASSHSRAPLPSDSEERRRFEERRERRLVPRPTCRVTPLWPAQPGGGRRPSCRTAAHIPLAATRCLSGLPGRTIRAASHTTLVQRTQRGWRPEWPGLQSLVCHLSVMPELLPCPLRLPRHRQEEDNPVYTDDDRALGGATTASDEQDGVGCPYGLGLRQMTKIIRGCPISAPSWLSCACERKVLKDKRLTEYSDHLAG
uniref:Transposase n=1 Tax=Macrostomum lignano TaxID=282301 RepID=A0A1I8F2L5_9PLAT